MGLIGLSVHPHFFSSTMKPPYMWDFNLGVWTQEAIDRGYRSRLTEEFQILGFAQQGWLTGPEGKPYGSTGIIVNCPVVYRFL